MKYYSVFLKVSIPINIESILINSDERKTEWGKSLEGMPVFTVRGIEDHKKESGKNGKTIKKTSEGSLNLKIKVSCTPIQSKL